MADADLKLMKPDDVVSPDLQKKFMSLLGGVAWFVQTRPDVAVFVSALQRKMQSRCVKPCVQDILKLKPLELCYKMIDGPWSLVAISDSSFKGEGGAFRSSQRYYRVDMP